MAQEGEANQAAAPPRKRKLMTLLLMGVVGLVSAGAGLAVPHLLHGKDTGPKAKTEHEPAHGKPAAHGHGHEDGEEAGGLVCVPFGDVVANLDDHRMMRYLRVNLALSADSAQAPALEQAVEKNKAFMKNWLIGYLQNKQIEEVRGTEGFNRVRREIQEQFNQMLFPDGGETIQEILFEEYNVQ